MSQPIPTSPGTAGPPCSVSEEPAKPRKPTLVTPCIVMLGGVDGAIFGGKALDEDLSDVSTELVLSTALDAEGWMGFSMTLPLGNSNEDDGFGISHKVDYRGTAHTVPSSGYLLRVKFPRGKFSTVFGNLDGPQRTRLSPNIGDKDAMTLVEVHLHDGARVDVEHFGIPFENRGHAAQDWTMRPESAVVAGDYTLFGIIDQRVLTFVVKGSHLIFQRKWAEVNLPEPFSYPYGTSHSWNLDKHLKALCQNRGAQFKPAWSFHDDNSHLAALTQAQIQDIMWIHQVAVDIGKLEFPAYFVEKPRTDGVSGPLKFFIIITGTAVIRNQYESAWRRLAKKCPLKVRVHDKSKKPQEWSSMTLEHPNSIDVLSHHIANDDDLVLLGRRPASASTPLQFENRKAASDALQEGKCWERVSLEFDTQLQEYKRKVDAVVQFHPDAKPTNPIALQGVHAEEINRRMALHRDLLRGQGFYTTIRRHFGSPEDATKQPTLDEPLNILPSTNVLHNPNKPRDEDWISALMEEALPDDRIRFRKHLTHATLGLIVITAGPGFGKTTAAAVVTVAMRESQGHILASAPTHVAADNFAARIDTVATRVTERYNKGREERRRHMLVVRAYNQENEFNAFKTLLRSPDLKDDAAPRSIWGAPLKWKLHLSLAFWALVVLGSPGLRSLRDDDREELHQLRQEAANGGVLNPLYKLISGEVDWVEYENSDKLVSKDHIIDLFHSIIDCADIICTLPSLAETQTKLKEFKNQKAKGIAVDEAANMNRPDLYSVWGNTLLPCLLAGDDKQLAPVVTTLKDKDMFDNAINRCGPDGRISPLESIKASGWPIYRLRVQLRMAEGQFELCKNVVYRDVPSKYGEGCNLDLPAHTIGRLFESYIKTRFPDVTSPPSGTAQPLFVHCEGSRTIIDRVTKSKFNRHQIKIALDFLQHFVQSSKLSPSEILIISPYAAMVKRIDRQLRLREYDGLKGMRPASTVDPIQGQEANMVVVITGTTDKCGPGFTSDERRLNVMLSRHKSALVIFGDKNTVGIIQKKGDGKFVIKGDSKSFPVVSPEGERLYVRATMLREVHLMLANNGRMTTIKAECEEGQNGKGETKEAVGKESREEADAGPKHRVRAKDKGKGKKSNIVG